MNTNQASKDQILENLLVIYFNRNVPLENSHRPYRRENGGSEIVWFIKIEEKGKEG